MEFILAVLVLTIIFGIGYLVGAKQEGKKIEKHFYNAKAKEICEEVDSIVVQTLVEMAKQTPSKKRKKKTVQQWEEEIDLGGNE
jgi:hypothetical protein